MLHISLSIFISISTYAELLKGPLKQLKRKVCFTGS